MKIKHLILLIIPLIYSTVTNAQAKKELTEEDKKSLEGIIVEKYYVATADDTKDTVGGGITKGAVTYRIYVDLKPEYTLQAVFGIPTHEMNIKTTTNFFNTNIGGDATADVIDNSKLNDNNVALDSWITMGAITKNYNGVPKTEDTDGSILKRKGLDKTDGMLAGKTKPVAYFGVDVNFFQKGKNNTSFSNSNGSWAVFGGVKGATESNKILIAQLTTDGKLSFELNIQVGTPTGGNIQYVAKNAVDKEIQFAGLTYKD